MDRTLAAKVELRVPNLDDSLVGLNAESPFANFVTRNSGAWAIHFVCDFMGLINSINRSMQHLLNS